MSSTSMITFFCAEESNTRSQALSIDSHTKIRTKLFLASLVYETVTLLKALSHFRTQVKLYLNIILPSS